MWMRSLKVLVGIGLIAGFSEWLGTYWDVWFHATYGRDSLFSMPHLMMLGGMLLPLWAGGLVWWQARKDGRPGLRRTAKFVTLFAAAQVVALFVVDEAWHRIYGQDAFIWSPPHLLIFAGFAANMLLLTGVAAGLAERWPAWWAGVVGLGAISVAVMMTLLAEATPRRAATATRIMERHRDQTHPHIMPWLAVLMAPALVGFVFGALWRIAGGGWRAVAVVLGCATGFTAMGWLLVRLFGGRFTPAPPMLVIVGAAAFAVVALGASPWLPRLSLVLAGAAFGPALWHAEVLLRTHYAFGVKFAQPWMYGVAAVAAGLFAWLGGATGERLLAFGREIVAQGRGAVRNDLSPATEKPHLQPEVG